MFWLFFLICLVPQCLTDAPCFFHRYKKNRFQSQPKHQESRVPIVPFTLPASSNGIFRFLHENFDTAWRYSTGLHLATGLVDCSYLQFCASYNFLITLSRWQINTNRLKCSQRNHYVCGGGVVLVPAVQKTVPVGVTLRTLVAINASRSYTFCEPDHGSCHHTTFVIIILAKLPVCRILTVRLRGCRYHGAFLSGSVTVKRSRNGS